MVPPQHRRAATTAAPERPLPHERADSPPPGESIYQYQHLVLPADGHAAHRLRQAVRHHCRRFDAAGHGTDDMVLAVSEAFSNAVRHGSRGTAGELEVWIYVDRTTCRVTLRYPGEPFSVNEPTLPEVLSLGGRGSYLISCLTDHVEYQFADGLTLVRLVRHW